MASTVFAVVMFVSIAGNAVRQYRRQRALGITMQWGKLFTTLAGCMIVALIAIGALFAGMATDQLVLGLAACIIVMAGGLFGLIRWVNRRWPRRVGE